MGSDPSDNDLVQHPCCVHLVVVSSHVPSSVLFLMIALAQRRTVRP